MNKINKLTGFIIAIMILTSSAFALDNAHFSTLKTFKDIKANITGNALIGKNLELYLVKGIDASGRPFEVVTDSKGNYLILSSKVIDIKKQTPITIPMDISILKDKEAFTFGTGPKHYYVFTDPECPYCHKFEATWPSLEKDVTLHVFFFNLDFHKEADAMSRYVLSGATNKEKGNRLIEIANSSTTYKNSKYTDLQIQMYQKVIDSGKKLGLTLGVKGTPTVIDFNGKITPWNTMSR